ncbi:RsiV family protein [Flavobacteriaceae bacterium TK19130]|nr:RsiV family protein [Thermobacterium salinum]
MMRNQFNSFVATILVILLVTFACKNDTKETTPNEDTPMVDVEVTPTLPASDSINDPDLKRQRSIVIKQENLQQKPDKKQALEELLIEKTLMKEEDLYTLEFRYPLLNEKMKASHGNFNEYILDTYVDVAGTEAAILEASELLCDTIRTNRYREKRIIDYKVYNLTDKLVSILFYKENFYSGTLHPTYAFDCMNFDLNRGVFMKYEDFFVEGSEEELRAIINDVITTQQAEGELYYDCWKITSDDFFEFKNNFVINDEVVEYYFDDCVVCPSYSGNYVVQIPLQKLLPVLRRYAQNPLLG